MTEGTLEQWDEPVLPRVQSTHLYHLPPVGVGTADAESLTSYLTRLATAHRVGVRDLVVREIQPCLGDAPAPRPGKHHETLFWKRDAAVLNGLSGGTQIWVNTLQRLTGRTDLRGCTMRRWHQVLSANALLRDTRAWCPACYADQQLAGVVYDCLLWALRPVLWCQHHQQPLVTECDTCHHPQPLVARITRLGWCCHCGQWLGQQTKRGMGGSEHTTWPAQVVRAAGSLVAAAHRDDDPPRERIAALMRVALGRGKGHGASAVGRRLQLSDTVLLGWQQGRLPQLENLIRFSIGTGQEPAKVLTDPELTKRRLLVRGAACAAIPVRQEREVPRMHEWAAVEQHLATLMNEPDGTLRSVSAVARELGVNTGLLRRRCPEACRHLAARYQAEIQTRGRQRRAKLADSVRQVVRQLYAAGVVPTEQRVTATLGVRGALRAPEMRAIWRKEREMCTRGGRQIQAEGLVVVSKNA
jgi:transposase-like protein